MAGMAQTFADALQETEASRDPGPVAALFADGAEIRNLAIVEDGEGAARRFWQTYLDQFQDVRSTFSHMIEGNGQAALVWTSEGALKNGDPIAYRGVSVIEHDGGKVSRFETIYDSAAFVRTEADAGAAS